MSGTEGAYTFGDIGGDATNGLDVDVTRSALPTGASTSANQTTIIGHLDGVEGLLTTIDADTGAMLTALQTLDNAIAGNEMQVDIVSGGITGVVDDAAFTPGTTETVAVGFFADESAPDSVDEGDLGAARMTLDRKQIVTPRPHASGGLTIFRSIDLDETEEEIKATAGQLYGYYFANTNAAARYLKFYNATAANVTVGTTTPVLTLYLPASSAGHVEFSHGVAFSTAITAAATTGVADNDTGAPSANDVILNAFYA